jgi:serine/threonine protein kinase
MEAAEPPNLRIKIEQLQRQNANHQSYIPDLLLCRLITYDIVCSELKKVQVNPIYIKELAERVIDGAVKVFSILVLVNDVMLLRTFIEEHKIMDYNLPLELDILQKFGVATTVVFYKTQWMFLAPHFTRSLLSVPIGSEIVLPFLKNEEIGVGGFGTVFEITLDGDHQVFPEGFSERVSGNYFKSYYFAKRSKLVRKELKDGKKRPEELDNLAILSRLKHSNIVELLCSYRCEKRYNLVFPLAEDGDLAAMFRKKNEWTPFQSDETLLFALAGLASALERVHEFSDEKLDLALIECHHDFRPRNILISNNEFILADFGLSRFKKADEKSKTLYKRGTDHYLAPECVDLDNDFKSQVISKSSDIWSFGCILAEFMVYLAFGPEGVEEFAEERSFERKQFRLKYFHYGSEKNPCVEDWLSKFDISESRCYLGIVGLTRRMLAIPEKDRPKVKEVTAFLRFMLISELTEHVNETLQYIATREPSLDLFLELTRFEAWKYAFGIVDHNGDFTMQYQGSLSDEVFNSTADQLKNLQHWLNDIGADMPTAREVHELAEFNDSLELSLSEQQQGRARTYFTSVLLESEYSQFIDQNNDNPSRALLSHSIRVRAILKNMSELSIEYSIIDTKRWQILPDAIKVSHSFNNHSVGIFSNITGDKHILIEWCIYGKHASEHVINKLFFTRLNHVTGLLKMEKPETFRSLPCLGFFHAVSRYGFGVVYELPLQLSMDPKIGLTSMISLKEMIKNTDKDRQQPILEDKFHLAHTLANALLEFHMVGWLHEDFASSNIAFCPQESKQLTDVLRMPYIIGFNHGRPNEVSAFTSGFLSSNNDDYKHPNYQRDKHGYRQDYDYYSLGVVLLEIGLWETIDVWTKEWAEPAERVRERLLDSRVSSLGPFMGSAYQEAVRVCLTGKFQVKGSLGETNKRVLQTNFESLVVDRLRKRLD